MTLFLISHFYTNILHFWNKFRLLYIENLFSNSMQRTHAGSKHVRPSPYSLLSPIPSCLQWFSLRITQRKETWQESCLPQAPPWHSLERVSCFHRRSLYPLETPGNISALHNTEGVVTLHYALHLQAKYYHTQVNQKPPGVLSNHEIPTCGLFQNWTSKVFLHFYKSEESMM